MATLVIHTQYKENYSFDKDGAPAEGPDAHWKFKGGSTYFVDNLTPNQVNKIEREGVPTLTKLIEYSNSASEEYILDWEIRDLDKDGDGKGPICENWEIPVQFFYEEGKWLARTHHTYGDDEYVRAPIISKAEQWVPLNEQERSNYKSQYQTPSGWLDSDSEQLKWELANSEKMEKALV